MGVGPAVEEDSAKDGAVPVPVAAMMDGSAWRSSHSMVSPSDRWPSSLVNWKILAAQSGGIRTRRPRPLTLVCRSFVDDDGTVRFRGWVTWVLAAESVGEGVSELGLGFCWV